MSHLQADRLVLAALGETPLDTTESSHVDTCASCSSELESLRTVADVGRQLPTLGELPAPPPRVWESIAEELSLGRPTITAVPPVPDRRPRWHRPLLAAAVAAVLAMLGTALVYRQLEPAAPSCSAPPVSLEAVPGADPAANGSACLVTQGERTLRVQAEDMPDAGGGLFTVWLIDPSSLSDPSGIRLQPLGNLGDGPESDFPVPGSIDLAEYSVIDISREPNDGIATHSGDSLLRGQLP